MNEDCLKLTCYFGERHRSGGRFVADRLLNIYGRSEIASSIMLRGVEGFGLKHHLRSDSSLTLSEDLPAVAVAVAVDSRGRIESILVEVTGIENIGLVTLKRARLVQGDIGPIALPESLHEAIKLTVYLGRPERVYRVPAEVGVCELLERPHELPGTDEHGMALRQKLSIVTSAAAQHVGQPIYRAITRRLRATGSSGATSLRGIWGFHGDHTPHGDRPLQVGRHVPTLTIIDELTAERGLIISEMVPALHTRTCNRRCGGLRLASHRY